MPAEGADGGEKRTPFELESGASLMMCTLAAKTRGLLSVQLWLQVDSVGGRGGAGR